MNTNQLRVFVTGAETSSMTTTAAVLGLSQPTASRMLRRLETELGATLLDRNRKLRPTRYGETYLPHARAALAAQDAGVTALDTLDDPENGTLRLGFLHSLGVWLIPELLHEFRARASAVTFELFQGSAADILDKLRAGELDVAFTAPEPADKNLRWRALYRQQLVVAVPAGHPLSTLDRSVNLADVADYPYLAMTPGHGMRRLTDSLLAREGVDVDTAFEGTDIETLRGLAAVGLGVAIVPRAHRVQPSTAVELELDGPGFYRDIGIAWTTLTPLADRFCRFVIDQPIR